MIYEFRGEARKKEYFAVLSDVPGGTLSPGGAAQLLRVTRTRIGQMVHLPDIQVWAYYTERGKYAQMMEISARDLLRYGVRTGCIENISDVGLYFPGLEEELQNMKENKGF